MGFRERPWFFSVLLLASKGFKQSSCVDRSHRNIDGVADWNVTGVYSLVLDMIRCHS